MSEKQYCPRIDDDVIVMEWDYLFRNEPVEGLQQDEEVEVEVEVEAEEERKSPSRKRKQPEQEVPEQPPPPNGYEQMCRDRAAELRTTRSHCKLMHLSFEAGLEELNQYLEQLMLCLRNDEVLPSDPDNEVQRQNDITDSALEMVLSCEDLLIKRVFLWMGFYVSPSFVHVFTPRVESKQPFTVDPGKFAEFVFRKDAVYVQLVSLYYAARLSEWGFVTACAQRWMEMQPWQNVERYNAISPDHPSIEASLMTGDLAGLPSDVSVYYTMHEAKKLYDQNHRRSLAQLEAAKASDKRYDKNFRLKNRETLMKEYESTVKRLNVVDTPLLRPSEFDVDVEFDNIDANFDE